MTLSEPIQVTLAAAAIFDSLGIPYVVGGSLASSLFGIPRATQDIDIVINLPANRISDMVDSFSKAWHIDETIVREAVACRSSFNVIHLDTMYKIDIFVMKNDPFYIAEMNRRKKMDIDSTDGAKLFVTSAEDIILQKLHWYMAGGKSSGRQLEDVRGVLKVQKNNLDISYLNETAAEIGVADLLADLLKETSQ